MAAKSQMRDGYDFDSFACLLHYLKQFKNLVVALYSCISSFLALSLLASSGLRMTD